MIMLGGVAAAIIGPQIVIYASGLSEPFSSAFYMATILFVLSFFALMFLNPSNLGSQQQMDNQNTGRSLTEIILQSRFLVAVFAAQVPMV